MAVRRVNPSHDAYEALAALERDEESFSEVVPRSTGSLTLLSPLRGSRVGRTRSGDGAPSRRSPLSEGATLIRGEGLEGWTAVTKAEPPRIYRLLLQATNLAESQRFYETLLGTPGRRVGGGRIYFDCGPVILGILDQSTAKEGDRSTPTEAVYLATDDLEGVHERARTLGCLSTELIHSDPANPAGEMVVRPWGERSFYAADPSGNPLCFVDARTLFTGTSEQVAALARAHT